MPEGQTFYDTSLDFFRTIMKSMGPRFEQWRATLGLPSRTLEEQIGTWQVNSMGPRASMILSTMLIFVKRTVLAPRDAFLFATNRCAQRRTSSTKHVRGSVKRLCPYQTTSLQDMKQLDTGTLSEMVRARQAALQHPSSRVVNM